MKRLLLLLLIILLLPAKAYAVEDPLRVPNNKFGIHILFDHELEKAAEFVNSSGGDWGYVTIPIQKGDKDLVKWQTFMDRARDLHIIPLVRLASEGDYFNTSVWKTPTPEDIVDFANFLDSLTWPTKNRYIIVYNETNRGDEWGGEANPEEYATLLSYAVNVFKSKSQDYFIISAGLDNAAPDQPPAYINEYTYLHKMQTAVPGIFNQIDGFASHSYPNPGFSQPPSILTAKSISSFKYERELISGYRNDPNIPVFITETGWNNNGISDSDKAAYFLEALNGIWSDPGIVAVTPFLLNAGDGPFKGFSFITQSGSATEFMTALQKLPKVKGNPVLPPFVLGIEKQLMVNYPTRDFTRTQLKPPPYSLSNITQQAFKWMFKL